MKPAIRKALLIVPPTGLYIREDRCQTPIRNMATVALRPPTDLLYAGAAFERAGVACKLVDYPGEGLDRQALTRDLDAFQPDLVLMSITTPGLDADMAEAAYIKQHRPGCIVAAKGAHFNTLDLDAMARYPALDLALRGEYEETLTEIARGETDWDAIAGISYRRPDGSPCRNADRPLIQDLDAIPYPARHLARNELYRRPDTGELQTNIVTNRGCPFSCIYCLANQVSGRKNRVRSVENIMGEIRECVEQYGIRSFLFRSDLFTANRKWLLDLCRAIRESGLDISWSCNSRVDTIDLELAREMKEAGCWLVAFGIESGNEEILEKINKRTDLDTARRALKDVRRAGILSSVYFLVGLPWDTDETLRDNERFARELDPDILEVFYAYPFPGTELYRQAVELGLLEDGEIPREAYDAPAIASLNFTRDQLTALRNRALKRFYLQPKVIVRTLARSRSLTEFTNYLRYGLLQLRLFLRPPQRPPAA